MKKIVLFDSATAQELFRRGETLQDYFATIVW